MCATPGKGLVEKGKFGFIDKTGQTVIEPQTDLFCMFALEPHFSEGPMPCFHSREKTQERKGAEMKICYNDSEYL